MKGSPLKLLFLIAGCASFSAYAAPYTVLSDNETVTVDDDFVFTGIISSFVNTTILVDTSALQNGLISSGVSTAAISIEGAGSLDSLTIDSGTVSSENADPASGTVSITGDSGTSPIITIGKDSTTSGIIENRGSGNAIYAGSENTSLTINNKATGTVSSVGNAIILIDASNSSSLNLNNAGSISGADYALYLDGYSADITNSGTISGTIIANSDSTLSITNNAGEISGDIDLGINVDSIINLNGGTISGNVVMRDDNQLFVFNGGNLDGSSIDGYSGSGTAAGSVRVDVNTTLNGSIGKNNAVSLLQISDGVTFSFNDHDSQVAKISLGAATLNDNYGDIATDEIDGSSAGVGIFNLSFLNGGEITYTTPTGTTNGLEQFNIIGNSGGDPSTAATIILEESILAGTTSISGTGSILRLGASNIITGNVEIGDSSIFQLDNGASVTGTIQGSTRFDGTLEIYNPHSDGTVNSVTLASDVGGGMRDLSMLIGDYATIIDASTNDVAINAQTIRLYNLSNLQLGLGTVTGDIKGYVDSGSSNGFGDVTFTANNTLGGNVGSSDGNALHNVTLNSGVEVTAGNYEINALNIDIGNSASLTSSGLISGGDNDDAGASLKDAAISLADSSSLTLNTDSSIYATIDGPGDLTINTTLNSSNSHLNIGDVITLNSVTLSDGATLDVTGNNGKVNATSIYLGNNSTLSLGDAEIIGAIDGNGFDDYGTLDIQGDVTLYGAVGGFNSIHLLNIGSNSSDPYSVTALGTINASSITINGSGSSLLLDGSQTVTGDVTIGDSAELIVGIGASVNGTIVGASKYQGILTIGELTTFASGGDIGVGGLDLAEIRIHGNFDLSGLSNYEAHAQLFSLTEGASLTIGAGIIEGNIKGFDAGTGGVSHGSGKGSVSFATNTDSINFLISNIGTNDGHAIAELSVGENLTVDTGSANISAARITLYEGASLISSASTIDGGDQVSGGFSRLNTQITLNDNTFLTLNNVGTFLGTIDGNDSGQGNLTLTGSYIYDDGDDAIDIGATNKLSSITLSDDASLDVSRFNGFVKADAITLGNNAILTVGNSDIVGTVDGASDLQGTFNILGNTTLHDAVGFTHQLQQLNIGDVDKTVSVTANSSIAAVDITLSGDFTTLALSANSAVNGDVVLGETARLNFNDGASVDGTIKGAAQYNGQINILASSSVTALDDIGGDGFDLASVGINDAATLTLGDHALNAQSISLIDDAELVIGSATVTGNILGYDSSAEGSVAYGTGKGTVTFNGSTNTLGGNIGNDSGNAVNAVFVNGGGKSLDTNGFAIYSANFTVATNSHLTVSGIIAGSADATDDHALSGTNLTLNGGATLTLNDGASFFGKVNGSGSVLHTGTLTIADSVTIDSDITIGDSKALEAVNLEASSTLDLSAHNNILKADLISLEEDSHLILGSGAVAGAIDGFAADNKGKVSAVSSATFGSDVTFGTSNGLAEADFGNNAGATINVTNSIKADLVKVIGSASNLILGDTSHIYGNVVLDGDSILTLGNGSVVEGTITNLSDSTANGSLVINTSAAVVSNGNIGGGGYNFYAVSLKDDSSLDLSGSNNTINALLVQIADGATLTIGSGTVTADIQAHNTAGGSNYGLGKVVFVADNTLGGSVGSDSGATLEKVTIDSGVNITGGAYRINALDIALNDGAILTTSTDLISGGQASEGAPLSSATISLGDNAILDLNGTSLVATVDGVDDDSQGQLKISFATVTAYDNIGNSHSLESVNITSGGLDIATHNVVLKADNIYLDDNTNLLIGTGSVTGNILGHAASGSNNGFGTVAFNGATNSLAGNVGGHNDNALGNVTISSANSVTAGSHEINATTIYLGSYATLTTSGAISGGADITGATPIATAISLDENAALILNAGASIFGTIDGASDVDGGMGSIEIAANYTTNGDIGSLHKLSSVIIDDDANLDLVTNSNSLNAATIYLGTDSIISLGGVGTIGTVYALSNDVGTLNFSGGGTLTLNGDIGSVGNALSTLSIGDNSLINAYTNGTSIIANNIYLSSGAGILIADGILTGAVHGGGDDSSVSFLGSTSHTLSGNLGSETDADTIGSITTQSHLDLGSNDISTDNFIFDSSDAALTIGSGNIDIASFTNNNDGEGKINFSASNDLNFVIDTANTIAELNIYDGATLNVNQFVNATNITIGNGTSGKLILAADKTLVGDVRINNGANLTINSGSQVLGQITGASSAGGGTFEIAASISITPSGYIGNADHKLAEVKLNADSTLNIGSSSIVANLVSLGEGATLQVDSGTINATILGSTTGHSYGEVVFTQDNSLLQNIGSSSNKISSVTVNDNATLTANGRGIYADNVLLGDASIFELQNNSFVNSNISGAGEINASGAVTFGGNINVTGDFNINGNATFSQASTNISANSFNVNSGSALTLSIDLNSPSAAVLGVTGAATISENTNLNLTLSGTATSGTTITLLEASAPSEISLLSKDKLNLNNSGKNIYRGKIFSIAVIDNKLELVASGSAALTFNNPNIQQAYNAIINATDAGTKLTAIQNYLADDDYSNSQKESVIKSTTPQADNSANRVAFSNITAMGDLISSRLHTVRTGTSSGDEMHKKGVWMQAVGSVINQGATSATDGYSAKSSGFALGFDREISDDFILGFGGAYNNTTIDAQNNDKTNYINSYQLNIYSGYTTEEFFLNSSIGMALNDYKSSRSIALTNSQAKANYSGQSYHARLELGQNYRLENKIIFTPTFTVTAANNKVNSYSESGAQSLNLHVNSDSSNFFEGRIGGQISKLFKTKNGDKLRPNFSLSYGYDFAGDKQKATSNFIGQNINFSTTSARVAQGSLKLGAGVDLLTQRDVTINATYNIEHRDNYVAHTGWLRGRYEF